MKKTLFALALLALLTACGGGDPEDQPQTLGEAVNETRTVQPVDGATAIGRKDPEAVTQ